MSSEPWWSDPLHQKAIFREPFSQPPPSSIILSPLLGTKAACFHSGVGAFHKIVKISPRSNSGTLTSACNHAVRVGVSSTSKTGEKKQSWVSLPTNIFRKEELPSSSLCLKVPREFLASPINIKQEKEKQAKYYRGGTIMMPANVSREKLPRCFRWPSVRRVPLLFSHWEGKARKLPKVTSIRMYTSWDLNAGTLSLEPKCLLTQSLSPSQHKEGRCTWGTLLTLCHRQAGNPGAEQATGYLHLTPRSLSSRVQPEAGIQ